MSRGLIGLSPARLLLLDVTPPFEALAGNVLCDALENVLCLGANLAGPSRIPLFGVYLLTSYPEVLLPLTPIKQNFTRLHTALADVRGYIRKPQLHPDSARRDDDATSCIGQAVLEACGQFRRHVSGIGQAFPGVNRTALNELEIIVLTGHSAGFVKRQLGSLPSDLDLSHIKRLVSATVTSNLTTAYTDIGWTDPSPPSEDFGGLSEVLTAITLDCDEGSLQRFFYAWFTDVSAETEHLQLELPPPSPLDPPLTIKCDLTERMLFPNQLPCHDRYSLHAESNSCKCVYPTPSKASGMVVSVVVLKVVRCMPRTVLCESTLYGVPLLMSPTVCWSLDWEDLEQNRYNFTALCAQLAKDDQVLLTKLISDSTKTAPPGKDAWAGLTAKSVSTPSEPSGFFVLMPSKTRSLLVKSVVCSELLLPLPQSLCPEQVNEENELLVQASLSQVETSDRFSPLDLNSGLLPYLTHTSLPKSQWRATKRPASTNSSLNGVTSANKSGRSGAVSARQASPRGGLRLTATAYSDPLRAVNKTAAIAFSNNGRGRQGKVGQRGRSN